MQMRTTGKDSDFKTDIGLLFQNISINLHAICPDGPIPFRLFKQFKGYKKWLTKFQTTALLAAHV